MELDQIALLDMLHDLIETLQSSLKTCTFLTTFIYGLPAARNQRLGRPQKSGLSDHPSLLTRRTAYLPRDFWQRRGRTTGLRLLISHGFHQY